MKKSTDLRLRISQIAACAVMACSGAAHAAITCNLSSNGFSSAYVPANAAINITTASFTMTCTRSRTSDATSQAFTVQANNGTNASGQQNRAAFGSNRILYDLYTDSSCSTQWRGTTTIGGTVVFSSGSDLTAKSTTVQYWGCIPAGQNVAAGTYSDTVTLNPSTGANATFPVSIVTPSSCSISTPPGNITFNYIAFQGSPSLANTAFSAKCTNLLPYSMALDSYNSVLAGLAYTLSLSTTSNVGNGVAQPYTIDGSMAAGQSGTCTTGSCTATEGRTLTITY